MKRTSAVVLGFVAGAALFVSGALAQVSVSQSAGPVPPAILSAKKIFVSNAGADAGLFPHPFSGDPDRGYDQLYAGLKTSGQ